MAATPSPLSGRWRLSLRKLLPLLLLVLVLLNFNYWNHYPTWTSLFEYDDENYYNFRLCFGERYGCSSSFPQPIQMCNLSALHFQNNKMHKTSFPLMFTSTALHHPVAYGPFLTKCGSSSTIGILKYLANETTPLNTPNSYNNNMTFISQNFVDHYKFLSFVRHPLERALAGYSQIEIFLRLGWINPLIADFDLKWWNTSCIDSAFGRPDNHDYPCTGSAPSRTNEAKLKRLHAFLVDLETAGFYDQHITPQTYLLVTNPIYQLQEQYPQNQSIFYFYLEHMDQVHRALCRVFDKPVVHAHLKNRKNLQVDDKNEDPKGHYWQVKWDELKSWSSENVTLAQDIIDKLCSLYRHDVECLPYEVPECKYD